MNKKKMNLEVIKTKNKISMKTKLTKMKKSKPKNKVNNKTKNKCQLLMNKKIKMWISVSLIFEFKKHFKYISFYVGSNEFTKTWSR